MIRAFGYLIDIGIDIIKLLLFIFRWYSFKRLACSVCIQLPFFLLHLQCKLDEYQNKPKGASLGKTIMKCNLLGTNCMC